MEQQVQVIANTEAFLEPLSLAQRPLRSCARKVVPLTERIGMMVGIGLCVGTLWFLATQSAAIENLNQRIAQTSAQLQTLSAANAYLGTRVSTLQAPSRILQIAHQNHMHEAVSVTISQ